MILIWDMDIGGIQKRVKDLVLDIEKNLPDWEIHLLVKNITPSSYISEISKRKRINIYGFRVNASRNNTRSPLSIFWVMKYYIKIKPDVVLTFLDHLSIVMSMVRCLCFWQNSKLVLNEGNYTSNFVKIHRRLKIVWNFLIRNTYKYADKIIVPTQACREDLEKNFSIPKRKIFIIPNWTTFSAGKPDVYKYDLIFAGRLEKEKNLFQTIDVVKKLRTKLPDIKMAIVGKGSLEKTLKEEVRKLKLNNNIHFLGYQENAIRFIKESRLFLLTSINEGMPNTVLEAACFQVPAIIYNYPGADEVVIHGKTGYITSSPKKMTEFIYELLTNPKKIKLMGISAQKNILKNFHYKTQKRFIDTLLK